MSEQGQKDSRLPKGTKRTAGALSVILAAVFALEGGYVNHRNDPGGETNHGITEKVARNAGYTGRMRDLGRYCEAETDVCAESILRTEYVDKPGFMPLVEIDPVVAEEVIDTAVNMGPARPSRYFQRALNDICGTTLKVDGKIGAQTVKAWDKCRVTYGVWACHGMLDNLDQQQLAEYERLIRVNPKLGTFRRGWLNHRINNVDRARCQ